MDKSLYDLSYLLEFDDPNYLIELLDVFLTTTPPILSSLELNVEKQDWDEVYRDAHTLRGSLGMLQMQAMVVIVTDIEQLAKHKSNLDVVPQKVKKLLAYFTQICVSIEKELLLAKSLIVTP
jgi:HPt (histidine-containing phosphotransfer) domain-containing protein